jgi:hypothetical protein
MEGDAWKDLKKEADKEVDVVNDKPDISNADDNKDVYALAKALVYVRTGIGKYRDEVIAMTMAGIGTERGGPILHFARNIVAFVIAADLVGLPENEDKEFRAWIRSYLVETSDGNYSTLGGDTLSSYHRRRPNNHGLMAGAARAAVAIYLGDHEVREDTARVFKGYLGDRSSYAGFEYRVDMSWHYDENNKVGINPKGATKIYNGVKYSIDGALPEEMRRSGSFQMPPVKSDLSGYTWEGMQAITVMAEILYRAGYNVYEWEEQAILRAVKVLYMIGWFPEQFNDDDWEMWVLNKRYGTSYPTFPAGHGKNMGWTDWTHGRGSIINLRPSPPQNLIIR